jgi:hypothetical protein
MTENAICGRAQYNPLVLTMDAARQVTATFNSYKIFLPVAIRSAP